MNSVQHHSAPRAGCWPGHSDTGHSNTAVVRPGTAGAFLVHVQLRPRWAAVARAMAALDALIEAHPSVPVGVCGLSRDARYLRLTLSVDAGPVTAIARFSTEAIAAYSFVSDVYAKLFDHSPCYAGPPTAEERAAAMSFGSATPNETRGRVRLASVGR